jgi:homoserine kinase
MISLPLPSETEQLIARLSDQEKNILSLMIQAFVAKPKRSIEQVMDDMTSYAKRQGLTPEKLDDILKAE